MEGQDRVAFMELFDAEADSLFAHSLERLGSRRKALQATERAFSTGWDEISRGGNIDSARLYGILEDLSGPVSEAPRMLARFRKALSS